MRRNKVLCYLTVEDFQTIANEQIGRPLTDDELTRLADWAIDRMSWHDLICEGLNEFFPDEIGGYDDEDSGFLNDE